MTGYAAFGERLVADGVLSDPWLDGAPRFAADPLVLTHTRHRELCAAAVGIARVHDELARLVHGEPDLATRWFGLTPWQCGMWQCSAPDWHGIARADVFWTEAGAKVCELNSDTPSGEAEAVLLNANVPNPAGCSDPNIGFAARFVAMVETWAVTCGHRGPLTVGLLYPTEMTDDLSMVAVYRRWLHERGHRVVLGSPFNVGLHQDGRATLFDVPCDVVVRHYKTDWFGERLLVADDDAPHQDREPLQAPLLRLLTAAVERRTAVVNPFGAVLTQNKRALAFCHEEAARFSPAARAAIARWLPRTVRLENVRDELWDDQARWVLKSDYGCEGEEVVVGRHVDRTTWQAALAHAITRRWVAQEWFAAEADAAGQVVNHGVYVVGGAPAGLLARVHDAHTATGPGARMVPVFVREEVRR
ncbi:MAG: glutathionylspermidine synthase family protein [Planctomycetes bacterium]|nr:glutathionylspermidine synthase family protein [Planctomycetota bacterium]